MDLPFINLKTSHYVLSTCDTLFALCDKYIYTYLLFKVVELKNNT